MRVLLWKEWRENSGLFIAFLVLSFCGMAVSASVGRVELMGVLQLVLCVFFASLLGANLIAGEAGTKTFQFLSTQPIRRRQIWTAKVGLGAISISCLMLITLGFIYLVVETCAPEAVSRVFPQIVNAGGAAPRVAPLLAGNTLFWATLVLLFYSASLFASGIFDSAIGAATMGVLGAVMIRFFSLDLLSAVAEAIESLALESAVFSVLAALRVVIAAFRYVGATLIGAAISNVVLAFLFLLTSFFSFTVVDPLQKTRAARAGISVALVCVCGAIVSLAVIPWYLYQTSLSPRSVTSISCFVPSSDGKRIAFMPRGAKEDVSQVWVIDSDGENLRQIRSGAESMFWSLPFSRLQVWSSDGKSLLLAWDSFASTRPVIAELERGDTKIIPPRCCEERCHMQYVQWLPGQRAFMYSCWLQRDVANQIRFRIGSAAQNGDRLVEATFAEAAGSIPIRLLNRPIERKALLARIVSRTQGTYNSDAQYDLIEIDLLSGARSSIELQKGVIPLTASSDGKLVALQKVLGERKAEVWLRDLENWEEKLVTGRDELDTKRFQITFSRNGDWIYHCSLTGSPYYDAQHGGTECALFSTRTGVKRELPDHAWNLSFSPDARWVVYLAPSRNDRQNKRDAWVMNLETGETTIVIPDSHFASFEWSPNGRRAACRVYKGDRHCIWTIDPRSKEAEEIWREHADVGAIIWSVAWLSDDKLTFVRDIRASFEPFQRARIWIINADGSEARQIFPLEW